MPFKSDAQRRFMYARHPKIAERWEKEYPKDRSLPERKVLQHRAMKKALDRHGKHGA